MQETSDRIRVQARSLAAESSSTGLVLQDAADIIERQGHEIAALRHELIDAKTAIWLAREIIDRLDPRPRVPHKEKPGMTLDKLHRRTEETPRA